MAAPSNALPGLKHLFPEHFDPAAHSQQAVKQPNSEANHEFFVHHKGPPYSSHAERSAARVEGRRRLKRELMDRELSGAPQQQQRRTDHQVTYETGIGMGHRYRDIEIEGLSTKAKLSYQRPAPGDTTASQARRQPQTIMLSSPVESSTGDYASDSSNSGDVPMGGESEDQNAAEHGSNESDRRHECTHCNKKFNRPSSLRIHMNTHTGAKPYECPFPNCHRQFNVSSNMRRHFRGHTQTKSSNPYHHVHYLQGLSNSGPPSSVPHDVSQPYNGKTSGSSRRPTTSINATTRSAIFGRESFPPLSAHSPYTTPYSPSSHHQSPLISSHHQHNLSGVSNIRTSTSYTGSHSRNSDSHSPSPPPTSHTHESADLDSHSSSHSSYASPSLSPASFTSSSYKALSATRPYPVYSYPPPPPPPTLAHQSHAMGLEYHYGSSYGNSGARTAPAVEATTSSLVPVPVWPSESLRSTRAW